MKDAAFPVDSDIRDMPPAPTARAGAPLK